MRWKLTALVGWGTAAVLYVGVCKLVRELLDAHTPSPTQVNAGRAVANEHADLVALAYPGQHSAAEWGKGLSGAAAALARDGFEDQAHRLFGIGGELLEAHDRGNVRSMHAL